MFDGYKIPRFMSIIFPKSRLMLILLIALLPIFMDLKTPSGQTGSGVDMMLIISLDVSASVDRREYQLMVEGLSDALLSPEIARAIKAGNQGAIGFALVQWSGFSEQETKIKWIQIGDQDDLGRLADEIKQMGRRYNGGATDIGGSIDFTARLFDSAPFIAQRKVIDIVGDGPNNVNFSPSFARDRAISSGIIINALAITGGIEVLGSYFSEFVIGGQGAFVEKAGDFDSYKHAIKRKLLREIGDLYLF